MLFFYVPYCILLTVLCLFSYRKGLMMYWASILLVPTAILNNPIGIGYFRTLSAMLVTVFALMDEDCRSWMFSFMRQHATLLTAFMTCYILLIFSAETVPVPTQMWNVLQQIWVFVIIFITFFAVKDDPVFTRRLAGCAGCCLLINIAYCLVFEIILRFNPAGLPLYRFLSAHNATDMINYARGIASFRLQSVFGHPLSLGQYMLIIYPVLFLYHKLGRFSILTGITLILVPAIIFLTGTRGAIIPLLLLLPVLYSVSLKRIVYGTTILLALVLTYYVLPVNRQQTIAESAGMITDGLQFWSIDKQKKAGIVGSTFDGRIMQMNAAVDEISSNPLTGRGFGYREWYQRKHNHVHPELQGYESIALLYLVEGGIVGLLMYLAVIFCLYRFFIGQTECFRRFISLTFGCFITSVFIIGDRPLSLLIAGLCSALICGLARGTGPVVPALNQ